MIIYNYSEDGLYLGTSVADESPLEEGVFLIPARSTEVAPPEVPAGSIPKWLGDTWAIVEKNLGQAEETGIPLTDAEKVIQWRNETSVTRFQALAALLQAGLLGDIEAYISSESTDAFTKLAWKEVLVFKRVSPLVTSIGSLFGLSDGQIDDLFRFAETIDA